MANVLINAIKTKIQAMKIVIRIRNNNKSLIIKMISKFKAKIVNLSVKIASLLEKVFIALNVLKVIHLIT